MKTPVTSGSLRQHFTYNWWKYLLIAILSFGLVDLDEEDYEYMGTTGKIYLIGIDGGATFINNYVAPGDPECIGQTGGVLLVGGEMDEGKEISMYTPAYIVNGTIPHSILLEMLTLTGVGTAVYADSNDAKAPTGTFAAKLLVNKD